MAIRLDDFKKVQFIARKWTLPHLPPRHPQRHVSLLCSCVLATAKLILSGFFVGARGLQPQTGAVYFLV
uniref:Uncharacterized protein n=1 Tax=Salvator merianae TaxID=96440 RepID=A0A8D0BCQ9_SALMN